MVVHVNLSYMCLRDVELLLHLDIKLVVWILATFLGIRAAPEAKHLFS